MGTHDPYIWASVSDTRRLRKRSVDGHVRSRADARKNVTVQHTGKGFFDGIPSPLEVMRYHSLTVDHDSLPGQLEVIAWGEDDKSEIHAIRHREHPVWGVQFHPESVMTENGRDILGNFLDSRTKNHSFCRSPLSSAIVVSAQAQVPAPPPTPPAVSPPIDTSYVDYRESPISLPLGVGFRIPSYNRVDGLWFRGDPKISLADDRIRIDPDRDVSLAHRQVRSIRQGPVRGNKRFTRLEHRRRSRDVHKRWVDSIRPRQLAGGARCRQRLEELFPR